MAILWMKDVICGKWNTKDPPIKYFLRQTARPDRMEQTSLFCSYRQVNLSFYIFFLGGQLLFLSYFYYVFFFITQKDTKLIYVQDAGTTTENSEYCDMTEVELGMVREKAKKALQ